MTPRELKALSPLERVRRQYEVHAVRRVLGPRIAALYAEVAPLTRPRCRAELEREVATLEAEITRR